MNLRNICFVRHAKSSWDHQGLSDVNRPLNGRGEKDGPFMANKMKEIGITADYILTSPAVRARTTAGYFKDAFDLRDEQFEVVDDLYGAGAYEVIDIVQKAQDQYQSLFVFGHNPTMTILANKFAGISIDNVPTCGIFQAKTMVEHWSQFNPDTSAFVSFFYPKQYSK